MKRSLLAFWVFAITACQFSEYKDQDLTSQVELSPEDFISAIELSSYSIDSPINYQNDIDFSTWVKISDLEGRFSACDISRDKAKSMTTDAIVRSILHYPLNYLIFAYNNPYDAVRLVLKNSNVHAELLNRGDAAEVILQYFKETEINMSLTTPEDVCTITSLSYSDELFLEYLIASGEIEGLKNQSLSNQMMSVVNEKIEKRENDSDKFSEYSLRPLLAIGHNMLALSTTTLSYVYTYFGQALGVRNNLELSAQEIFNITEYFRANYPDATVIRQASSTYNCHSYAWYDQSTSNHYWLSSLAPNGDFQLQRYWTDDYYYSTTESNAERVFYSSGDHSAIALQAYRYVSKWGQGPLMEHAPTDCPYISSNRSYYHHRTSLPYDITSSIVGNSQITVNTVSNYSLPHFYQGMNIVWTYEPYPGLSGSCHLVTNSDGSCSFSADTPGAYYLHVTGTRNGEQVIAGYSTIIVYGI